MWQRLCGHHVIHYHTPDPLDSARILGSSTRGRKSPKFLWMVRWKNHRSQWGLFRSAMFEPTGGKPNQRLHVSMSFMGLRGWGGVGWANNVHLHYLTYMMVRYCTSSCTASHTWCYATVSLLALPHIHDATCYATVRLLALPHIHDATLL